jgi:hypothetical protein
MQASLPLHIYAKFTFEATLYSSIWVPYSTRFVSCGGVGNEDSGVVFVSDVSGGKIVIKKKVN